MEPSCGGNIVRYVGDVVRFVIEGVPSSYSAVLRTNIGRGKEVREGIIKSIQEPEVQLETSWRDIPMQRRVDCFDVSLALSEVGWFQAKAYALDSNGNQYWPEGDNIGISVHPNSCRAGNTIYCAFPRMFGANMYSNNTQADLDDQRILALDEQGYTVIPSSGTFRSLAKQFPHIFETLGCKILHLLPVGPTPTTYARMGRFGSPYACGDLTAVDPALVEFDKRTTGVEQFCEMTDSAHGYGAQVFLDLVINHTGWGSRLQNQHPEWFLRESNGDFASPGAWGVIWGDLVELDPNHGELLFASHPPTGEKIKIDPHELISGKKIKGTWGGGSIPDRDIPLICNKFNDANINLGSFLKNKYFLDDINLALKELEIGKVLRPIIKMVH